MARPRKADILYICDWLPPDFGAVGQYSLIFAQELARQGNRVVLAGLSSGSYEETEEALGGGHLRIIKLRAKPYKKSKFGTRLLWTVRINTRLALGLWRQIRLADEIRFTGSPPLFLHWVAPLGRLFGKRLVYRITDFHPECLIAARGHTSWWLNHIYQLTLFWRRRVTAFEVLGEDQRDRLIEAGIEGERIHLKRDGSPVLIDNSAVPLERPNLEPGKLLLLYSGNWGVAHEYKTFLEAYRLHHRRGSGSVILWLNARGTAVETIETRLREDQVPYCRSDLVPVEKLASLLVTPDAHLITLSDAFVGYVLPSKVYGCVASKKPILFIGSERSDVHRLCSESEAYYSRVPEGAVEACAAALEHLAAHVSIDGRAQAVQQSEETKGIVRRDSRCGL